MNSLQAKIEAFKRDNPERAQALYEEGAAQERDRWRGIEAVAKDLGLEHAPLARVMKGDGRCDGSDLARAAIAMRRPLDSWECQSQDRIAIQREANAAWDADAALRHAFSNNKRAHLEYRVAMATTTAATR